MNYFPMFMDIGEKEVLICGGGKHAMEKIRRLEPFGACIRVISSHLTEEMEECCGMFSGKITVEKREFRESDLDGFPVFVIAAEGRSENERIVSACRERHIPVNAVDMQDICDFIFPAMLVSENACIGISTGGLSPAAAVELKHMVGELIPEDIDGILQWLQEIREKVRSQIPEKERQRAVLRALAKEALLAGHPVTPVRIQSADRPG